MFYKVNHITLVLKRQDQVIISKNVLDIQNLLIRIA